MIEMSMVMTLCQLTPYNCLSYFSIKKYGKNYGTGGAIMKLTDAKIRKLIREKQTKTHGDGRGLYLRIAATGSASWSFRAKVKNGRKREIGLGSFPDVSLAEARDKALEYRKLARDGIDPMAEKGKAKIPTFREASEKSFEVLAPRWRSEKTRTNRKQTMARYVYPAIGQVPVNEIGRKDLLEILLPVWSSKPQQGLRIRRHIREVLEWSLAHGYVDVNLAGDAIKGALPSMHSMKKHFRTIPYDEVPDAMAKVQASGAHPSTILCFEMLVLTATRSQECRLANWSEFDLDNEIWTIPAERAKTRKPHRVPLSTRALEILSEAKERFGDEGLVFPSARGKAMSDSTLSKLVRELGIDGVPHAIARATFRSWCADSNVAFELAEAALAHVPNKVVAAYQRSDLIERRRVLMQSWSDFLTGAETAKVIPISA